MTHSNDPISRPTLLAVLAHPDDETFGIGGTLALYAWCGVTTHLICATNGEEGDVAPELLEGYGSVAARRRAELDCAARTLGLAGVHLLGYRDSGMPGAPSNTYPAALAAAPLDEVTARVTHLIRRIRPQVVITFDPIGGYRHPDHIAIHQATVRAFAAAGDPQQYPDDQPPFQPQKLYYSTFPRWFLRTVIRLLRLFGRDPRRFGRNADVDLTAIADVDFPLHARIDYTPLYATRAAAGRCHASQGGGSMLLRGLFGLLFRLLGGQETFMRAHPPAAPGLRERDLFEGVEW